MRASAWGASVWTVCLAQSGGAINVGPGYTHPIEGITFYSFVPYHIPTELIYGVDLNKDLPFSQPVTFAHLEWQRCLAEDHNSVRLDTNPLKTGNGLHMW
jgi:agmatinase